MAHISLVTLGVDDLERSATFYEALGWDRSAVSVEGEVVFLRGGTVALGLFGRRDLEQDARVRSPVGHGHIALAVNLAGEREVDDLLAAAAQAGGRIVKPAERAEWGGYSGYLEDPDGHLWEVAHNPGFELRPDGSVVLP